MIADRLSGIPELVRDRVSGLLVPPQDPQAICDADSVLLATTRGSGRPRGARARSLIEREYNLETNTRALARAFADVLA